MSWLSVGKSFLVHSSVNSVGNAGAVTIAESSSAAPITDAPNGICGAEEERDRKASKHKRKHNDDKDKRTSKKHKKEKHKKKEKKSRKQMVVHGGALTTGTELSKDVNFSSSDDGFSSSDSDDNDEKYKKAHSKNIIRTHMTEIVNGTSEVAFLPNGEVYVLPKSTLTTASSDWRIDSRGDKDMILYEGVHPKDVVLYTLHPNVVYANSLADSSGAAARTFRQGAPLTSEDVLRRAMIRPSGITVPAAKQLKDFHEASKLEQIFRHRTQLLSERKKELRLQHKFRYFSPASRNILMEPSVKRLAMRADLYNTDTGTEYGALIRKSDGQLSHSSVLPLPFVEPLIMRELNYGTGNTPGCSSGSGVVEACEKYQSTADRAQMQANVLSRQVNQQLREHGSNIRTVLSAVAGQDTLSSLQRVAAGRPHNALSNDVYCVYKRANKTDFLLQKAATERKIAILEQAISSRATSVQQSPRPLYDALLHQLVSVKQADNVEATFEAAISDLPVDSDLRFQQWNYQLTQFKHSDYTTLSSSLQALYDNITHSAYNMQAAAELNRMVDNTLSANGAGGTSRLQEEFAQVQLQCDLVAAQCDQLLHRILLEKAAGHTERSIAIVQAVLDFNLCDPSVGVEDYCTYWDSEALRLGEVDSLTPTDSVATTTTAAVSAADVSPEDRTAVAAAVGYEAWIAAGKPAEPSEESLRRGCFTIDDFQRVYQALDVAYMSGAVSDARVAGARADRVAESDATEVAAQSSVPEPPTKHAQAPPHSASDKTKTDNVDLNTAAADYFLQQILQSQPTILSEDEVAVVENGEVNEKQEGEYSSAAELVDGSASATAAQDMSVVNRNTDSRSHSTEAGSSPAGAEEEEGWVYSRLHGYKIKISQENSGAIYKKILNEMSAESAPAAPYSATLAQTDLKQSAPAPPSFVDPIYSPWRGDLYAKYCQFRPLRALSPHDAASVEQQPERAIFSDDIKSSLFRADVLTTSSMYDQAMRQGLKQRLIIRCLQGLGVTLHHSECSHSSVLRSVQVLQNSVTGVSGEEEVLFQGLMLGSSGSALSFLLEGPASAGKTTTAANSATFSVTAAAADSVLSRLQRGSWSAGGICSIQPQLVRKHLVCRKFGFDSELSFIIRLVSGIVRRCCSLSTGHAYFQDTGRDRNSLRNTLWEEFMSQLRIVLVRLLTVRYVCDASLLGTPPGGQEDSKRQSDVLEEWRRQCRSIIEDTVSISTNFHSTCDSASTSSSGPSGIPAVGDLSLWSEYLTAECALGNQGEALKLADRVWKSLPFDANSGTQSVRGVPELSLASVQIALNITPPLLPKTAIPSASVAMEVSQQQVATALSVAVHAAHTGAFLCRHQEASSAGTTAAVGAFHPTYGTYSGHLKPPKKSGKKSTAQEAVSVDRSAVAIAVEILQAKVLELVQQLQDQLQTARRIRRAQKDSSAVRLSVPDCVNMNNATELVRTIQLMAWIQDLSCVHSDTLHTTDTVAGAELGDGVFTAAIALVSQLLFPHAASSGSSSNNSEHCATFGTLPGVDPAGVGRFSKHLRRLLPGSSSSAGGCESGIEKRSDSASGSVAESEYFDEPLTAEAEVKTVILLERLHTERIIFLLSAATIVYTEESPSNVHRAKIVRTKQVLAAASAAVQHFPLNPFFQSVHTTLIVAQPGGYHHMRAHFRGISQNRLLWGGGLQASECLLLVQLEVFQACRLLQKDPLCPASVAAVVLLALFDADALSTLPEGACTSNADPTAATRTYQRRGVIPAPVLPLSCYWSLDSASKVRAVLEYVMSTPQGSKLPTLWMFYIFLLTSRGRNDEAKKVFFRAVNHCGWCQKLFLLCLGPLRTSFTNNEVESLNNMIEQRRLSSNRSFD